MCESDVVTISGTARNYQQSCKEAVYIEGGSANPTTLKAKIEHVEKETTSAEDEDEADQDDLDALVSPNAGGMVSGVAIGGMANAFEFFFARLKRVLETSSC